VTDDLLALRRLADTYGMAVDDLDGPGMVAHFVPDGTLIVYLGAETEPAYRYRGEEIAGVVADMEKSYVRTFHLIGNHVCEVDGDRATARTYCVAYHLRDDPRGEHVITTPVSYRDTCVRTPDGWRFQERVARILWRERRLTVQWPPP
jgi:hypothetical protein